MKQMNYRNDWGMQKQQREISADNKSEGRLKWAWIRNPRQQRPIYKREVVDLVAETTLGKDTGRVKERGIEALEIEEKMWWRKF